MWPSTLKEKGLLLSEEEQTMKKFEPKENGVEIKLPNNQPHLAS